MATISTWILRRKKPLECSGTQSPPEGFARGRYLATGPKKDTLTGPRSRDTAYCPSDQHKRGRWMAAFPLGVLSHSKPLPHRRRQPHLLLAQLPPPQRGWPSSRRSTRASRPAKRAIGVVAHSLIIGCGRSTANPATASSFHRAQLACARLGCAFQTDHRPVPKAPIEPASLTVPRWPSVYHASSARTRHAVPALPTGIRAKTSASQCAAFGSSSPSVARATVFRMGPHLTAACPPRR